MTGIWGTTEHHFVNSAALLMLLSITMSQDEPAPSEARGPRQGGAGRRATLPPCLRLCHHPFAGPCFDTLGTRGRERVPSNIGVDFRWLNFKTRARSLAGL